MTSPAVIASGRMANNPAMKVDENLRNIFAPP
jgi:hypothetical protein